MAEAPDMQGKVCMVTGASAGMGKEAALELARMGATVVIVCRNKERGQIAQAEIQARSNNQKVDLILADLASQSSIREAAQQFKDKYQQLHVLVNNAGATFGKRRLNEDGLEMTFAVNHLAYFLLTNLLLDVIKTSAPARIINVSSDAHAWGYLNFDDLQNERGYGGLKVYGQSKLANVLFTYELARRLQGSGVTVNCLHPGAVASNFGQQDAGLLGVGLKIVRPFLISPERGARTAVYLATSPEVEGVTGKYFVNCKEHKSARASYDEITQKRLWEVSEQLTETPV